MKKWISIILALSLFAIMFSSFVLADELVLPYEDVTIDANGLLTCNISLSTSTTQTLIIPATYDVGGTTIYVKGIADNGFGGKGSIKGPIVISEGIESIGVSAFKSSTAFQSITIPSTVKVIGNQAFQATSALSSFILNSSQYFKVIDNALYTADGTSLVAYACGNPSTALVIPEGVTTIRPGAIRTANKLNYILYPSTLSSINASGTYACASLKTVVFKGMTAPAISDTNFNTTTTKIAYNVYYPEGATGYTEATFTKYFENGSTYTTFKDGEYPQPGVEIPSPSPFPTPSVVPSPTPSIAPSPSTVPSPTPSLVPSPTPSIAPSPSPSEGPLPSPAENPSLCINEVCSSNIMGIKDKFGANNDWMEIYNSTDGYADLTGYGLSDTSTNPMEYVMPKVMIPPHGYLVVFTATNNSAGENDVYGNFGISKSGETLYLSKPDGTSLDTVKVPSLNDDAVFGRKPDGGPVKGILSIATPGESNNVSDIRPVVSSPKFSQDSGFYPNEFNLSFTSDPSLKIYYTTDGTEPDPTNSRAGTYTTDHGQDTVTTAMGTNQYTIEETKLYTNGLLIRDRSMDNNILCSITKGVTPYTSKVYYPTIKVDKCMVIRAVAVDAEGNLSKIVTKSYFVGSNYSNLGQKYKGVPVISLVTDNANLFDYDKGLCVSGVTYYSQPEGSRVAAVNNSTQMGKEWERPTHIDFFEGDGTLGFSQDIGLRIRGRGSRSRTQKSLSIFARSEYGKSKIDYTLFPDSLRGKSIDSFDSFILRAGGDANCDTDKFQDALNQDLYAESSDSYEGMLTSAWRNCVVFMNGEFWGPFIIGERPSDTMVAENTGIDDDNIATNTLDKTDPRFAKLNWTTPALFIKNNDISIPANYEKVKQQVDIQSAMDYYFLQTYYNNGDWESTNFFFWNSITNNPNNPYEDGKLRFLLQDTDRTDSPAGLDNLSQQDHAFFGWKIREGTSTKYPGLLSNMEYRQQYVTRVCDLINVNYNPVRVNKMIDDEEAVWTDALQPIYYARWGAIGNNMTSYSAKVASVRSFFNQRPDKYRELLRVNLPLNGSLVNVTVNTNDSSRGTIKLNSVTPPISNNTWTGQYFTDYPITLTATPKDGYKFAGWQSTDGGIIDNPSSESITVNFSQAITLTATFDSLLVDKPQSGAADDPYIIENSDDLNWMVGMLEADYDKYNNKYYKLTKNIVLDSTIENNIKAIGTELKPFNGNFDGNYHTIKGINIKNSVQGQGLFGYVGASGIIKNVGIIDIKITSVNLEGKNVGSIVGNNKGLIENCYSVGGTLEGASTIGGIAGNNTGSSVDGKGGIIRNCFNKSDIKSTSETTKGGIAGKTEFYAYVENCYSLITPVPKVSDGGRVDEKTTIITPEGFTDGSLVSLLNKANGIWMQGESNPEFGTIRIDGNNITVLSDVEQSGVKLIITSFKDNQLIRIKIYTVNIEANTPFTQEIPDELKYGDKIKAMIWTDMDNSVKPIMNYTVY